MMQNHITHMQGIPKQDDSQLECQDILDKHSGTHLQPVPGAVLSDPSVTAMAKGKGQRKEGSENESRFKVGKVEGTQLLGWVMPDPLKITSVQTSACASPSLVSVLMDEVKYCQIEITAPPGTTPFP